MLKTHHVAVFLEPISKKPGQEGRRNTGAVANNILQVGEVGFPVRRATRVTFGKVS